MLEPHQAAQPNIQLPTIVRQIRWRGSFLAALVARDLRARYQGSLFGWLWPIFVQLAQLLVFTFLFASIFHVRTPVPGLAQGPLSYGLWLFTGLLGWNALQIGVMNSAYAFSGQPNLIKKIAFPLALLPLIPVCSAAIESLAGLIVLLLLMAITGTAIHSSVALLPIVLAGQLVFTAGLAYIIASVTPFLRDIPQTLGPLFLLAFYLTPIVYPTALVPARYRLALHLNPINSFIQEYRHLILNAPAVSSRALLASTLVSVIIFAIGYCLFRRARPLLGDVV